MSRHYCPNVYDACDCHPDGRGWIYFVQDGVDGPIKIGFSEQPAQRLQGLQSGNPRPLRFVGGFVGRMPQEKALHKQFDYLAMSGEWFRPEPDLLNFIASLPAADFRKVARA